MSRRDDERAEYCDICQEGGEGFGSYLREVEVRHPCGTLEWIEVCCSHSKEEVAQAKRDLIYLRIDVRP